MSFIAHKQTPVNLYHSTTEYNARKIMRSGKIRGTKSDQNNACGRVKLSKIWTCAVNSHEPCCSHGPYQFPITSSDLQQISSNWSAYRTKDYDRYRVEGRGRRVFYNFFLIPDNGAQMPARCMRKLYQADLDDDDPVQLFWNNGNMYIHEKDVHRDDDMTTTTTCEMDFDTQEDRSFHVAIVCWNLKADSAQQDDTTTDFDDMTEEDETTEEDEDDTEGDDTEMSEDDTREDYEDDTTSVYDAGYTGYSWKKMSKFKSNNAIKSRDLCSMQKPFQRSIRYGNNAFSVVPREFPRLPQVSENWREKSIKHSSTRGQGISSMQTLDMLHMQVRKKILRSVGTSKRAIGMESWERKKDIRNYDEACKVALRHAFSSQSPLTLQDLLAWHKILLRSNEKRAGKLREMSSQARCGRRLFVPGTQVAKELKKFLEALNAREEQVYKCEAIDLAAWVMWYFIIIHPFSDGNGRLSRLLVAWTLIRNGSSHLIAPLCTPGERRTNLIRALREVDSCGGENLRPLVTHMRACCDAI